MNQITLGPGITFEGDISAAEIEQKGDLFLALPPPEALEFDEAVPGGGVLIGTAERAHWRQAAVHDQGRRIEDMPQVQARSHLEQFAHHLSAAAMRPSVTL